MPNRFIQQLPDATLEDDDLFLTTTNTSFISSKVTRADIIEPCLRKSDPFLLDNEEWLLSNNSAGTGTENLIRLNSSDEIEIGNGITLGTVRTLNTRAFEAPGFIGNTACDLSAVTVFGDPEMDKTISVIAGSDFVGFAVENIGPTSNDNDSSIIWGDDVQALHFKHLTASVGFSTAATLGHEGNLSIWGDFFLRGNSIYNLQSSSSFDEAIRFGDELCSVYKQQLDLLDVRDGLMQIRIRNNSTGFAGARLLLQTRGTDNSYITCEGVDGSENSVKPWSFGSNVNGSGGEFRICTGTTLNVSDSKIGIQRDAQRLDLTNGDITYDGVSLLNGSNIDFDFTGSEVNTGKKWVNGKDIYRIVFSGASLPSGANTLASSSVMALEDIVQVFGSFENAAGTRKYPIIGGDFDFPAGSPGDLFQVWWDTSTSRIIADCGGAGSGPYNLVIEYTKV